MNITENDILAITDNSTIKNAKSICSKGSFINLFKSKDETFFMGECKGSGSKNYITSADFINSNSEPTLRCNCPSRKFPCKHSIALMYEILEQKEFTICDIPEDILTKREKQEKRNKNKDEKEIKPKKVNKTAKIKKFKKQIEGLELTQKMIENILNNGLCSLKNNSEYKSLAKQLGNYYIPGVQNYFYEFTQKVDKLEKEENYNEILKIFIKLNSIIKKSKDYLNPKIETSSVEDDENELYEELGGIWTLERLKQLGLTKENGNFIQLYFYIKEELNQFADTGYYIDCETGELLIKYNFRPFKVKNLPKDDSIFDKIDNTNIVYYPGNINRRVRFETTNTKPLQTEDYTNIINKATDLNSAIKKAKDYLKNTLSDDFILVNISFDKIGISEDKYILKDNETFIQLKNLELDTVETIKYISSKYYSEKSCLFGRMFYDDKDNSINLEPLSIVTNNKIIRL